MALTSNSTVSSTHARHQAIVPAEVNRRTATSAASATSRTATLSIGSAGVRRVRTRRSPGPGEDAGRGPIVLPPGDPGDVGCADHQVDDRPPAGSPPEQGVHDVVALAPRPEGVEPRSR